MNSPSHIPPLSNFINTLPVKKLQSAKSAQRFVLVTQVIPDQINIGYQKLSNAIVQQINGQEILSLKDVEEAFMNPDKGFHRIDFLPGSDRLSAVLPVEDLKQSNQRISNLSPINAQYFNTFSTPQKLADAKLIKLALSLLELNLTQIETEKFCYLLQSSRLVVVLPFSLKMLSK